MAKSLRTYKIDPGIPVSSVAEDISLDVSVKTGEEKIFVIETSSAAYPLGPESISTTAYNLASSAATVSVPLLNRDGLKVKTVKVDVERADHVKTKKVDAALPGSAKVHAIDCRPPQDVAVFHSAYMDHMPLKRFALDLNQVPYKQITDFVMMLAEKNGMKYTNVKLIGVFDPVPMHLATGLTLDPVRGILKYNIRKDPVETGGRRIVRVIYGRNRTTDDIISVTAPVT